MIFSSKIFVRNISVNGVWVAAEFRPDLREFHHKLKSCLVTHKLWDIDISQSLLSYLCPILPALGERWGRISLAASKASREKGMEGNFIAVLACFTTYCTMYNEAQSVASVANVQVWKSVACKEAWRHGRAVCGAHPLVDRQATLPPMWTKNQHLELGFLTFTVTFLTFVQ